MNSPASLPTSDHRCSASRAEANADSTVCCGSPVMKNMSILRQPLANAACTVRSMFSFV